ncbi:hypothetical protein FRX31_034872, partial [Thalictrum thalictroides]
KNRFHRFLLNNYCDFNQRSILSEMAAAAAAAETETKVATEDPKVDLFEDDDEFEEFELDEEWDDKEDGKEVTQQWEDDWDDDDVNDDFSLQLRKELESNTGAAKS